MQIEGRAAHVSRIGGNLDALAMDSDVHMGALKGRTTCHAWNGMHRTSRRV
jgi:hypothetical protein